VRQGCGEGVTVYRTIVIDPPWQYGKWGKASENSVFAGSVHNVDIALPYPSMTLEEIAAIPVASLADSDCELYLWVTQKYMPHGYRILEEWGFKYCTTLTWCKEPRGTGQGGLFTPTTEFILHGRIGRMPNKQRVDTTWWRVTRPNVHSRKPETFQDVIEMVSNPPRLEIFARRYRLGWDVFGNEVESNVQVMPL
jgi:N6-adenosine-specific RNA methylase IME4